ncbi:hypothetical protein V6N13_002891 [Hibiscus sabdariffa]|uniref:Uncharacterized protein n=2 Tax=Hibiscus sabdariffa TaxID=183260 RepID=A0ABR2A049_9ROSI
MAQFCIDLSIDVTGLLLALLIAVALMLTCVKQPHRRPVAIVHRIACKRKTFSYAAAPLVGINGSPDSQRQDDNHSRHPTHHCSPVAQLQFALGILGQDGNSHEQ